VLIPQPDNVSNVHVDGEMWNTEARDGAPGWSTSAGLWLDKDAFAAFLDDAHMVTFYSPTGRVIEPED
jgi:hypothetical protein